MCTLCRHVCMDLPHLLPVKYIMSISLFPYFYIQVHVPTLFTELVKLVSFIHTLCQNAIIVSLSLTLINPQLAIAGEEPTNRLPTNTWTLCCLLTLPNYIYVVSSTMYGNFMCVTLTIMYNITRVVWSYINEHSCMYIFI
jgi:hypothetical protein